MTPPRASMMETNVRMKMILTATILLLRSTSAAPAQSAYTTGTIASSEAADYGFPHEYVNGLSAHAPRHFNSHAVVDRVHGRPQH